MRPQHHPCPKIPRETITFDSQSASNPETRNRWRRKIHKKSPNARVRLPIDTMALMSPESSTELFAKARLAVSEDIMESSAKLAGHQRLTHLDSEHNSR